MNAFFFCSEIEYAHRSGTMQILHNVVSVLCCCYSACRMVVVKQGEVGLTQNSDKPEILPPGIYILIPTICGLIC